MHRLAVPSFILVLTLAFGCEREPAEEAAPETTAMEAEEEAPPPPPFKVDTIGPDGGTVYTPERFACVDIKSGAVDVPVEVKIQRRTGLETLDPEPGTSPIPGTYGPWEVLPPVHDISIRRTDNQDQPVFREGDLTIVVCAHITHGRDLQEAELARILDGTVDIWTRVDSFPAGCQMNPACTPRPKPTQTGALAPLRWLDGSPLTPTPAGAALHAELKATAGTSGGGCCSPFAAVLPEVTTTAE